MPRYHACFLAALSAMIAGCATVTAAPGADKIRFTVNAADVATCKATGNIKTPEVSPGLVAASSPKNSFAIWRWASGAM